MMTSLKGNSMSGPHVGNQLPRNATPYQRLACLVAIAAASGAAALGGDDFKVPRGQVTFDAEGTEGGAFHSRKPHVPPGASGLTIGRGYDMKERSPAQVEKELRDAGLDEKAAKLSAGAAGLSGDKARAYIKTHTLPEITPTQQKRLFGISYAAAEADVKRICGKADVVKMYGKTDWDKLHPAIKDLLVDLRFRGDYTPASRKLLQRHVAANNLTAIVQVIGNRANWPNVPEDRFNRRKRFAEAAK
jgi:hypothetical protein